MEGKETLEIICYLMPARRLEDRIRELCSKALAVPDQELAPVFGDLRAALHEHNVRLRALAAQKLAIVKRARAAKPDVLRTIVIDQEKSA